MYLIVFFLPFLPYHRGIFSPQSLALITFCFVFYSNYALTMIFSDTCGFHLQFLSLIFDLSQNFFCFLFGQWWSYNVLSYLHSKSTNYVTIASPTCRLLVIKRGCLFGLGLWRYSNILLGGPCQKYLRFLENSNTSDVGHGEV